MSIIEQAAKRLAELRRAGAALGSGTEESAKAPEAESLSVPERLVSEMNRGPAAVAHATRVASSRTAEAATPFLVPSGRPDAARPAARTTQLDLGWLAAKGYVTPDMPNSRIAQDLRMIKRPLLRNVRTVPNGAMVVITSAVPGEGKTFTAANLAISLAMEPDHTVLLVDADNVHPSLPSALGVPNAPGLSDLLSRDDLEPESVIVQTSLERLQYLPAGPQLPHVSELIGSERMADLLRKLAQRDPRQIMIFDTSPLLATSDARALAHRAGQVVMVVAADVTPRKTLRKALDTIQDCDVVLMLLNKASGTDHGTYYGYYADAAPAA